MCIYYLGIILGTFTMELGGKVSIECEKTGYRAELEFKLRVTMSKVHDILSYAYLSYFYVMLV